MRWEIERARVRNSFIGGLIKILDGLIEVLSFGLLSSSWIFLYVETMSRRKFSRMKKSKDRGSSSR